MENKQPKFTEEEIEQIRFEFQKMLDKKPPGSILAAVMAIPHDSTMDIVYTNLLDRPFQSDNPELREAYE